MSDRNDDAMAGDERCCIGPLAFCLEGFVAFLIGKGYAPSSVSDKRRVVGELSNWLDQCKIGLDGLDEERLSHFHATHCRPGYVRRGEVAAGQLLLRYLRGLNCIPSLRPKVDRSAVSDLTQEFGRYLRSERGLSPATLHAYLPIVRRLLTERFGDTVMRLDELQPVDIHHFVVRCIQTGSRHNAQLVVTALRSFLRFLQQRGAIATDLAGAVPRVANWRLSHLPKLLLPEQVERMLACCDRGTPSGQRDYAILLFLARLGVRAGEVVALTLDDLDWEQGEVLARGKGQRLERLPLPTDVGAALVDYLRHVRPPCSTRQVFVRMRAPLHGLAGPAAIDCVVCRALKRAELNPAFKGAHLLRHSLATDLLRRGASLTEIGQLLRHSRPTTQIYAKVDIAALRTIGLPWPGAVS